MICALRTCVKHSFGGQGSSYSPTVVVKNMKSASFSAEAAQMLLRSPSCLAGIAKHFRLGRQEDSHEFLRFSIDAMQAAALYGTSP